MGAWRRPGVIDEFHRKLVDGMLARGLSAPFAEQVFAQIRGFGEYGFPESHAASFALLVYVSAWLKCHHPAAFTAALLGSQPMGFYAPAQLVRDAREHGVMVLPVDVNASRWHATLEGGGTRRRPKAEGRGGAAPAGGRPRAAHDIRGPAPGVRGPGPAIRLGLEQVHGLGEAAGRRIEAARRDGPFRLPRDLVQRAGLERDELVHLARAGALESLGLDRRRAVWEALGCRERPGSRPLLDSLDDGGETIPGRDGGAAAPGAGGGAGATGFLPTMTPEEEVIADYRTSGLSLAAHPVQFARDRLAAGGVVPTAAAVAAPEGRRVQVAGIVLTRQRPATAKGMIFLTIEDETGAANVVVRPDVWSAAAPDARRAAVLVVHGRIQRRGSVVHVLATRLEAAVGTHRDGVEDRPNPSPPALTSLPRMSRDFC
jgi:error-prone DNA polymerase